jgi:hypothetical protein
MRSLVMSRPLVIIVWITNTILIYHIHDTHRYEGDYLESMVQLFT